MPEPTPITVRLGAELRALRTLRGLSQRDLSTRTKLIGQPRIHRIETGIAVPTLGELTSWLTATAADKEAKARLEPLLEAAHNPTRSWQDIIGEDTQLQTHAATRETAAKLTRNCQLTMIPGLLQTAEYARHLLVQVSPPGTDVSAQLAGRLERQHILYQEGRRFEFILGEQALLLAPADGVMAEQLDRLQSLATLATVELRVLPLRRHGVIMWHDFVYREPADPEERPYVDGELMHAEFATTEPDSVRRYLELWDRLWTTAAAGDEARTVVERVAREHRARSAGQRVT